MISKSLNVFLHHQSVILYFLCFNVRMFCKIIPHFLLLLTVKICVVKINHKVQTMMKSLSPWSSRHISQPESLWASWAKASQAKYIQYTLLCKHQFFKHLFLVSTVLPAIICSMSSCLPFFRATLLQRGQRKRQWNTFQQRDLWISNDFLSGFYSVFLWGIRCELWEHANFTPCEAPLCLCCMTNKLIGVSCDFMASESWYYPLCMNNSHLK